MDVMHTIGNLNYSLILAENELTTRTIISIILIVISFWWLFRRRPNNLSSCIRYIRNRVCTDNADDSDEEDEEEADYYESITQCPNPNCIRCRKYNQVNIVAKQTLAWVIKSIKREYINEKKNGTNIDNELQRIIDAVTLGPKHTTKEKDDQRERERKQKLLHQQQRSLVENSATNDNVWTTPSSSAPFLVSPIRGQYPTTLLVRGLFTQPIVTSLYQDVINMIKNEGKELRRRILNEYISCMQKDGALSSTSTNSNDSSNPPPQFLSNDVKNDVGEWKVLHLLNQGEWIATNTAHCPITTNFIKKLPIIQECIFGNAFISVLKEGTTIDPHCGPTNIRHRLHIPLHIPPPPTTTTTIKTSTAISTGGPILKVGKVKESWDVDNPFVFDDSLVHSVMYPTTVTTTNYDPDYLTNGRNDAAICKHARIVLIVDLWHSELKKVEREAITQLYPAGL